MQSYPRKLAYEYLEELANEFGRLYGPQVDAVARPYAFIKFGEVYRVFGSITATHTPVRVLECDVHHLQQRVKVASVF